MKIKEYILVAFAGALSLASCSLDETVYTSFEKDKYMNNAIEANSVLLGVYRNMTEDGIYGYHLSTYFGLPSDIAKVTGNELSNWRNVPSNQYTATEDEVQLTWRHLYNAVYDANDFIERLSVKVKDFSEGDKALAAYYMAEARALRALFYFELVRWYGNIPLMTETAQSKQHPSTFVQAPRDKVYEFIEKDLLYAKDILPYASEDMFRKDNRYRFSKGAVLGLLTKVYATWAGHYLSQDGKIVEGDRSKWEDAAKTAQLLVNSGMHSLLPDYETLWLNTANSVWDSKESLIEVSFYSPTITGNSAYDSSGRIGKWNGVSIADGIHKSGRSSGNWRVTASFASSWMKDYMDRAEKQENPELVDKRWALSVADYKYTYESQGKELVCYNKDADVYKSFEEVYKTYRDYEDGVEGVKDNAGDRKSFNDGLYPAKWDIYKYVNEANVITDANKSNVNWYVLRYADVLLLYAEAICEWLGAPNADAYEAVNMVRRRGYGFNQFTPNEDVDIKDLTPDQFRDAVRLERAYELAFEGHRRQDLVRWGTFYESIADTYMDLQSWHPDAADYYQCGIYTTKYKNELLPIPQRDLDLTNFSQNYGWEVTAE